MSLCHVWFVLQIHNLQGAVSIASYLLYEIILLLNAVVVCSGWAFLRIKGGWETCAGLVC